jgi:hypothetical protein
MAIGGISEIGVRTANTFPLTMNSRTPVSAWVVPMLKAFNFPNSLILDASVLMLSNCHSSSASFWYFGSTNAPSFPSLMGLVCFIHVCTVSLFADTLMALHSATCCGKFSREHDDFSR